MYRYISSFTQNQLICESIKVLIKDFKDIPKLATSALHPDLTKQLMEIQEVSDSWQIGTNSIKREFEFPSFKETFAFMGSVSEFSDKMEHYPKWYNKGNKVIAEISTPGVGLTAKDVLLAFTMEQIHQDILKDDISYISQQSKLNKTPSLIFNQWNSNYSKLEVESIEQMQKNVNQY